MVAYNLPEKTNRDGIASYGGPEGLAAEGGDREGHLLARALMIKRVFDLLDQCSMASRAGQR